MHLEKRLVRRLGRAEIADRGFEATILAGILVRRNQLEAAAAGCVHVGIAQPGVACFTSNSGTRFLPHGISAARKE